MRIGHLYRLLVFVVMVFGLTQHALTQTSTWNASIVSATSEEPQYISGDNWPGRPENHRWVRLVVQVTSPGKQAKLPVAQIRLSTVTRNYGDV